MFHYRWWPFTIVVLSLLCGAGPLAAQSGGGYGAQEVQRFRNSTTLPDSVNRLMRQDLNHGQPRNDVTGRILGSSPASSYNLGLSSPSTGKPFSSVTHSPTVSPYMNLFRDDLTGESDLNYQTLVRPQLDQQRVNAQVQRQNMEIARRVQSISARSDYGNPGGAQDQYPTGHPTSFRYYSHFYPALSGRR